MNPSSGHFYLRPRQSGFGLVELMVALVLSLFLIGGVLLMYASGKAATDDGQRLSRLQEDMRFAVEFMTRDVRHAGYAPSGTNPPSPFAVVGANQLEVRYHSDRNCEGQETPDPPNDIAINIYTLAEEGALRCNGDPLIEGLSSLQFAEIRDGANELIGVEVTLGFDPGGQFEPQELSFRVAFRNRILLPMWDPG